jgi:hypothetical protein
MCVSCTALETVAAHNVTFCGNEVADLELFGGLGFVTHFDDGAGEFVANRYRQSHSAAGPSVPFPNVEIRSAYPGVVDANEDVIGPAGRARNVLYRHAGPGCLFDNG